jgi:transcriptional regulator of acetoin/glycerol metabolism
LSDRLAREGLRKRGAPIGIDDAAFALLMAYPFPGDYAELVLIARRLVASISGDVVRDKDVRDLRLVSLDSPSGSPSDSPRVNVRASRSVS